jgi:hypothetical protein
MFGEVLNVHAHTLVFSDLEPVLRPLSSWDEEVLNLFVVYFYHTAGDFKIDCFILICVYSGKDLVADLRHDPFVRPVADHRVTLARASLPIGEKTGVVTVPSCIQNRLS